MTQAVQVGDQSPREGGGGNESPRMTSGRRRSPRHAGNGFLNSPAADVARPDKISGADINSICQEVSDDFSLHPMGVGPL